MFHLAPTDSVRRFLSHPAAGPLAIIAGMLALILVAGDERTTRESVAAAKVTERVLLTFVDLPQGVVAANVVGSGMEVARYGPGEGGFVRQTMRGFAMERRRADVSRERPFELARLASGHLMLSDPATGRVVALDAFGQTNAGVFAGMLTHAGGKRDE
jgi:putative photosynthetic complex assembly protein